MYYKHLKWSLPLFILTIFLYRMGDEHPNLVDQYYYNGLFPIARYMYDYTLGFLPLPFLYVMIVGIMTFLFYQFRKKSGVSTAKHRVLGLIGRLMHYVLVIMICFYWFWGFNYAGSTLEKKLNIQESSISEDELFQELEAVTENLETIRKQITLDTIAIATQFVPPNLESITRSDLKSTLDKLHLSNKGRPRVRILLPKGSLLHFSTAGVYIPFVFEGHVDGGLHHLTWPFTMSHEMAHGFGITDEGDCNFIAHLSCIQSQNSFVSYSGWLGYARYVMSNARSLNRERYNLHLNKVDRGIINDLREIYAYSDRYREILPLLRDLIYDQYLKSHGVSEGLASYHRIVNLKMNWQKMQTEEAAN